MVLMDNNSLHLLRLICCSLINTSTLPIIMALTTERIKVKGIK